MLSGPCMVTHACILGYWRMGHCCLSANSYTSNTINQTTHLVRQLYFDQRARNWSYQWAKSIKTVFQYEILHLFCYCAVIKLATPAIFICDPKLFLTAHQAKSN